jgi:myosin-crossreactive antigen
MRKEHHPGAVNSSSTPRERHRKKKKLFRHMESLVARTPRTTNIMHGVITSEGILHMVDNDWQLSVNVHNQETSTIQNKGKRKRIEEAYPICDTNSHTYMQSRRYSTDDQI